ncbi:MAG TPA: type II toxin-antitoxin system death-on-curing family toxin [Clostridiales bacterium]|jgi:death-on-curing protein|nr:type II toxin-antitoxin system death-on-curing family toxin [Clostridiales bacterium]
MSYTYISLNDAVEIHRKTILNSGGGSEGHIDLGRLESVLFNIQNDDYYPDLIDKLTHLFFSVCQFHCFSDGNKRLAITLSAKFLIDNGFMLIAQTFFEDSENISYHVAAGKIDKDLLHKILHSIILGTYRDDEELKFEIYNAIM